MKTIICIDRDGTIIYDDKYHLGSTRDWKNKIKILKGVINGLEILNKIPNAKIYMITNQPGVANKSYPLLTLKKAHEVCKYVVEKIKKKGGKLDGYFLCPHAAPEYAKKHKNLEWNKKMVCNCSCIKPNLGMVFDSLKKEGVARKDAKVYVIGDRVSDVKTGINAKGIGILVPFENRSGEDKKVRKLKNKNAYVAKDFADAAHYIKENENENSRN